ncbi:MAG: PhaM family polyhydroxyalkanoate granule multifunctional regulatory protein [Betaproteobacteria bacterium]
MTNPPPGAPDYFALFQSMFTPGGASPAAPSPHMPSMFAMLDPKELERKIGELETVLAWLKATTGMIEMSLQTMKYQQSLLNSLAEQKSPQASAAQPPNMEELAKMAGAMNPALWAFNMMQPGEAPKAAKQTPKVAPRAATKKARR